MKFNPCKCSSEHVKLLEQYLIHNVCVFCSCYIQEVISCLVLLSEASWYQRLSLIFDVFKCSGNDEMMYDDVVLASQVIAMSLYRLWGDQSWDQVEWGRLTESIADGAFSKVRLKIQLFSNFWVVVFKEGH